VQYADREAGRGARVLDAGRLLVGIGALALLISLFLDWYGGLGSGVAITAWTSFEVVDLLLVALALAALYAVVEGIVAPERAPRAPGAVVSLAGPVALVLVLVSIIDEPPIVGGIDPTLEAGAWVALAGAVAMTVGAVLGRVRISLVVGAREPGRAPADPAAQTQPLRAEPGAPTASTAEDPGVPPQR
jgi:hypothetical protein